MNETFNESCFQTLKRGIPYAYVITSPPDYEELNLKPDDPLYETFLRQLAVQLNPTNNAVTIILRDRKADAEIKQKHVMICELFKQQGWRLSSQKIWVRSFKVNLFRFMYSFILTFKRKKVSANGEMKLPDALFNEIHQVEWFKDNFPPELIQKFVEVFTKPGEVVFDPFMGSGATAVACMNAHRKYLGAEIEPRVFELYQRHVLGAA
jgi:DNA modification methylase